MYNSDECCENTFLSCTTGGFKVKITMIIVLLQVINKSNDKFINLNIWLVKVCQFLYKRLNNFEMVIKRFNEIIYTWRMLINM